MILIASISVLFFGVVIAFSPSMIVFTILRSCVAASTTALFTCGFVYCMELVGGKWSTLVSFGLEYSWALGYITIPLIALAVGSSSAGSIHSHYHIRSCYGNPFSCS